MTREEAKLIGVTTVPNKGLEYVWYENYLKKIDEIYDSLEQQNTALQARIKELEDINKNYGNTILELRSKVMQIEKEYQEFGW